MALSTSKPMIILGLLLLAHACYSAYEYSSFQTSKAQNSPATATQPSASANLPLDIALETVISVILICVGLVMGAEELKPIKWRVWAGKVERESGGGGPFQGLEERLGFADIRAKRKEFADWIRNQDADVKKK